MLSELRASAAKCWERCSLDPGIWISGIKFLHGSASPVLES